MQNATARLAHDNGIVGRLDQLGLPAQVLLDALAVRHIADHAHDLRAILGIQGAQIDVYRELAAIGAPGPQIQAGSHGPHGGLGLVMLAVLRMPLAETAGHQLIDGFAQQVVQPATEHFARQRIRQDDVALAVHLEDGVRRGLEDLAESKIRPHHVPGAGIVPCGLQLQRLPGGDRQPEKFAGMQAVRGAFQNAVHQEAGVGVAGQNDEGDRSGRSSQGFQRGAPTPAGGRMLGDHQVVLGLLQEG